MKRFAFIYLAAVPFLAAGIGFGFGGFPDQFSIPVWIVHSVLMLWLFKEHNKSRKPGNDLALPALFLFIPWVLFALFAGFGPPPSTPELWLASKTQQQCRYGLLVAGTIFLVVGFYMLASRPKTTAKSPWAEAGLAFISIAAPLYILNMLYWGFYLPVAFTGIVANPSPARPDWYMAVRELFSWIGVVSVALIFVSTAFFAMGLKKAALLKPSAANVYVVVSLLGAAFAFIPAGAPDPLAGLGYFVTIPAISFIGPYLLSLNIGGSQKN